MKHFKMNEFSRSETALKLNINNAIPLTLQRNIEKLVDNVLDPVREFIKEPIFINSGYRCPRLNRAVGGVYGSQHTAGMAADITTKSQGNDARIVDYIANNLAFDQLIVYKHFIHVSYNEKRNRKQVLYGKY